MHKSKLGIMQHGTKYTHNYRVYAALPGQATIGDPISFWRDVPLKASHTTYHFVCEIPKHTRAKMEVATDVEDTPIMQDRMEDGSLRYYNEPIIWNYGMLPQTWEDPSHVWDDVEGLPGDGDPVDVIELGRARCFIGGVYEIKLIGAFALIDEGEVDWKILALRCDDALANRIDCIEDVERLMPGELDRIRRWFKDYKVPNGKPENRYGYGGAALSSAKALAVVAKTHALYRRLI